MAKDLPDGRIEQDQIRIYIPETHIPYDGTTNNKEKTKTDISCTEFHEMITKTRQKSIGYFDENVIMYIVVPIGEEIRGKLNIDLQYGVENSRSEGKNQNYNRQGRFSTHKLGDSLCSDENRQIWMFSFNITSGRNYNNVTLNAYYEKEIVNKTDTLKPFTEINLIQISGIDLFNSDSIMSGENTGTEIDGKSDNLLLKGSTNLRISSLYKMALKSYKTEKTISWLDLSSSKTVNELGTSLIVNSITVECSNCDVVSCTPIKYPVTFSRNSLLTIAYHVSYDEELTIKPLVVIIDATVDGHKNITTKWTSNLDLSNHGTSSNNSSGNLIANKKLQQQALLPAAKISKQKSYNNLLFNSNTPKLIPPRSRSINSVSAGGTTNGNSGLGGKRYSSVRLRSGSNLSLSKLWSVNTSEKSQRGLVVTVSGPTRVKLGEKFRWKIQLLNKSSEKMDLILYVQSSIKKEYEKTVPPIPIQSGNTNDVVPLFTNNQLVRSFYYKFNRAGLVSLTNNLRVSLEYGNLYECELELLSVERGMFNIYDFKVLDIASGDIFECNRLLDVMVV